MAARQHDREVTFRICVGDYKPTKVTVSIHKPYEYEPFTTVECTSLGKHGLWISKKVILPECELKYVYSYQTTERNVFTLYLSSKTVDIKEPGLRRLPPNIGTCCDVLKCPKVIQLKPGSLDLGLLSHINVLFSSVLDSQDVKTKLIELEHTWEAFDPVTLASKSGLEIQLWTEKTLSVYDRQPHKVIFLSVLYGKLAECRSMNLKDSRSMTISGKRKILTILEDVTTDSITKWSLSGLRETALQVLECVNQSHWLYVAAYFPHLFENHEVLDLRESMRELRIDARDVENTIIPKILDRFTENDAQHIIREIPNAGITPKERAKFQELVDQATRSQGDIKLPPSEKTAGEDLPRRFPSDLSKGRVLHGRAIPENAVDCKTPPQTLSYSGAVKKGVANGSEHAAMKLPLPDDEVGEKLSAKTSELPVTQPQVDAPTNTRATDNATPKGKVSFRLLVRDKDVTMVHLILHEGNNVTTNHVMESRTLQQNHYRNKWTLATRELYLPLGVDYHYNYIVTAKTSVYNVLYDTYDIHDITRKPVSPPCQVYDTLTNPRDHNISRQNEIQAEASLLYADTILGTVLTSSLKESVIQVEMAGFPGFGSKHFCNCVIEWINKMIFPDGATGSPLSAAQIKFLAVLFGKLIEGRYNIDKHCLTIPVFGILINTLENATISDFPTSVIEGMKKVCMWLIAEQHGTWIDFWRYFHKVFDMDSLSKVHRLMPSPRWVVKSWENDKLALSSCLNKLSHDAKYLEQLTICAIDECSDTRIFKLILDEYYKQSTQSAGDSIVVNFAINKVDDMIKKRWVKDINMLTQIAQDLSSTNSEITQVVRRHIVNFLSKQTWERGQLKSIRDVIMDPNLYQTSNELTEIVRNMLKQSDHIQPHAIFMDIVTNQSTVGFAKEDTLHDLLEMGIQSLASACRSRRRDQALRFIYKILAATKDSKHLSYESIQNQLDKRAYSVVKDVPLDCFFQALSPDGKDDFGQTELTIMASHITQRLREDKQTAVESTIHMKQLQDSSGKLVIRSQPMRDLLLAMIDMQELSIPVDQTLQTGSASLKLESSIRNIMKDNEFWIMVFESQGEYSLALKEHPNSKNVADGLRLFGEFMLDRKVTIHFVQTLKKKHVLLELLEAVCPNYDDDATNHWEKCLKRVEEVFELFRQARIDAFTKFFNNCIDMFSTGIAISDTAWLSNHLQDIQQPESSKATSLRGTESDEFWWPLFPLTNLTTELKDFMLSSVFRNICRYVLAGSSKASPHELHLQTSDEKRDDDMEERREYDDNFYEAFLEEDSIGKSTSEEETEDSTDSEGETVVNEVKPLTGQIALDLVLKNQPIDARGLAMIIAEICVPIFQQHCNILLKGTWMFQ
ncbi:uncharacterized protein [Amphiura filiformis]|uniref:uncharacterized protein n=1 Tax=Amphiura filiformis TaxID=82378 RepID=UPI003B21EA3B